MLQLAVPRRLFSVQYIAPTRPSSLDAFAAGAVRQSCGPAPSDISLGTAQRQRSEQAWYVVAAVAPGTESRQALQLRKSIRSRLLVRSHCSGVLSLLQSRAGEHAGSNI